MEEVESKSLIKRQIILLRAENKRLREALEYCKLAASMKFDAPDIEKRAKQALNPKKPNS